MESSVFARDFGWMRIVLPVGISFYTFQAISYVMDAARADIAPRKNPSTSRFTSRSSRSSSPVRSSAHPTSCRRSTGPIPVDAAMRAGAVVLILSGLFKKMVVANYLSVLIVDPVFGVPGRAGLAAGAGRRGRLRDPDLLRLLGLFRHRHRRRAAARLSLHAQLQPAVPRPGSIGLLAPLAHLAVHLDPRLPLHPARRQPRRRGAADRDAFDHHDARRSVARGGVDLSRLGVPARRWPSWWSAPFAAAGARCGGLRSPRRCSSCSRSGSRSARRTGRRRGDADRARPGRGVRASAGDASGALASSPSALP